ncbi:MAG: metalloregulator ArsR/SmtB family transcription factor [Oscillospiraceae bacterium]|nr:metalloregulator ArsR/SmtB family transcription factor [Oscillospiraceae bacterium]
MGDAEAVRLFKCLADKSRLQILRSLTLEDMDAERLAERLDLTPATISFHMKKLMEAGVVSSYKQQYYTFYTLHREVFDTPIMDIIVGASEEAETQDKREAEYRRRVIESFFEYGKLKSIPVQRKKERIILEEIAKYFEVGKVYTEREVNIIIADFHDDFCTIRRDMISEKIMAREDGKYWLVG